MANKFNLTIVTPDGKKVTDEATILNVTTTSGALGIMAHHLPLVAILDISHLNYKKDDECHEFAISGGVVNVQEDKVIVLADAFESKEEIDFKRAEEAKQRAETRLNEKSEKVDIVRATAALKRALNRLSLK